MAISFTRYVDITSGVGGGAGVRQRDLIGRIFSTNELIPTKSLIEFDNADDVLTYFGAGSEEYDRAAFYFGWISKNITKARKLAFARWADVATAPQVFGKPANYSLTTLQAITAGQFTLQMGADSNLISGLDFSGAVSLAAVASILQTAIQAETGAQFTAATVTYDSIRKSFNLVGGSTAAPATISVTAGASNDVAAAIGWLAGAILSDGVAAETVTEVLSESTDASNNFGSFLFMPALTIEQVEEAATWNATQNVLFQYCVPVSADDASDYYDTLKGYQGTGVTLSGIAGEYPEMIPMMILAATDYSRRNSTQNYMFQQFNVTPSVTRNLEKNIYDPLRVNYYGRTQSAGQFIDFYQVGVLMGLATNPTDMNTYANEQWLKDAAGAAIMSLLLSLAKVSANASGRAQLIATVQSVVQQALFNGTISVGKPLDNTQKQFIIAQTGDELAWLQVQNIGYWLDCALQSYVTVDNRTEWKAVYTLIYSKDDVIRKVEGSHQLI